MPRTISSSEKTGRVDVGYAVDASLMERRSLSNGQVERQTLSREIRIQPGSTALSTKEENNSTVNLRELFCRENVQNLAQAPRSDSTQSLVPVVVNAPHIKRSSNMCDINCLKKETEKEAQTANLSRKYSQSDRFSVSAPEVISKYAQGQNVSSTSMTSEYRFQARTETASNALDGGSHECTTDTESGASFLSTYQSLQPPSTMMITCPEACGKNLPQTDKILAYLEPSLWKDLLAGFVLDFHNLDKDVQLCLIARLHSIGSNIVAEKLWEQVTT